MPCRCGEITLRQFALRLRNGRAQQIRVGNHGDAPGLCVAKIARLKVDMVDVSVLRALLQHLPFPLVLLGNHARPAVANECFSNTFGPVQLDDPELRRLVEKPEGTWQTVELRCRDGRMVVARAKSLSIADHGALLLFDRVPDQGLAEENQRLRERIAELESVNISDPLTGAWNRAQLERVVNIEIGRALRSDQPATLILLDLDHFKRVNDTCGHLNGDNVLKEFVARIRTRIRDTDSLFRWGGDEFVVLATSVGYRGGAVLAEGLRRTVAATPFEVAGQITASLGVTEYIEGETAERWLERTDQALYAAKLAGRNRIHVDLQGSSDHPGPRAGAGVLRLYWIDAYECGDKTIDAEHRELFELGNALIAAAIAQNSDPGVWGEALQSMLVHLEQHFHDEEALLSRHGYGKLDEHQRAHVDLLTQANELRRAVDSGQATLGHLVNFLVNDVIALHVLKIDRDFYLQLQGESAGRPVHVTASSDTRTRGLH